VENWNLCYLDVEYVELVNELKKINFDLKFLQYGIDICNSIIPCCLYHDDNKQSRRKINMFPITMTLCVAVLVYV